VAVTAGVASVRHAFGTSARYVEISCDERVALAFGDATVALATMTDADAVPLMAGTIVDQVLHNLAEETATQTHVAVLATRAAVPVTVREWDQAERDPCSAGYYTDPD